jgi:hypothetical protein
MFIQGIKVGHAKTVISLSNEGGRDVVRIHHASQLRLERFGQQVEMTLEYHSIQTPDGKLLSFETKTTLGTIPMVVAGQVEGEALRLDKTTAGRTSHETIAWSPDAGGFYAVEESLRRRPMQPAEARTIRKLDPATHALASVTLTARSWESTPLPGGPQELLRIEGVTILAPGQEIAMTLWADREGVIHKSRTSALELEAYRVSKREALAAAAQPPLDIGLATAVPLNREIARPHQTRRIHYRVTLERDNPAELFVSGPSQDVRSVDQQTAEIIVRAMRPTAAVGPAPQTRDPPTAADREPNDLVQSDDPKVMAMARQVAPDETDPAKLALALERFVHERIAEKNFSQAFATASEVARQREGDCTEHAVLLAALARARGIPARAALGLVYSPASRGLAFHMWNELFIGGEWIPYDATLGQGGIGAAHLKLVVTDLRGATGMASFVPVAQVMGQLSVEVVDVE